MSREDQIAIGAPSHRGRFQKGVSGNPKGRPPGSRNATSVILQNMLDSNAVELMNKTLEMAKAGEKLPLKLCIERLLPALCERSQHIELPEFAAAATDKERLEVIVKAVAEGQITPGDGETFANIVYTKRDAEKLDELQRRMWEMEQKDKGDEPAA